MGYRDIGDFQRKSGDLSAAIRSYSKSRDYCTTSQHILDMCLSIIDVGLLAKCSSGSADGLHLSDCSRSMLVSHS